MATDRGFVYMLYDPHTREAYIGECGHDDPDRKLRGYLRSRGFRSRRRLSCWLEHPSREERLRITVLADGLPTKRERLDEEERQIKAHLRDGWRLLNTVHHPASRRIPDRAK